MYSQHQVLTDADRSDIYGLLYCDSCNENTKHYTKAIGSNGKTYCSKCDNMTEYTERWDEGLDL